jgi:ankyrin repeat protein
VTASAKTTDWTRLRAPTRNDSLSLVFYTLIALCKRRQSTGSSPNNRGNSSNLHLVRVSRQEGNSTAQYTGDIAVYTRLHKLYYQVVQFTFTFTLTMNNDAHSDRHQVVRLRPTEAQLRWSQFHHRRRALTVQENVQRLWLQPASVSDVEGARSDDGNTTEESQTNSVTEGNNNNNMVVVPRRGKPVISRGRRAMLRISKRAFRERHRDIEKYGFCRGDGAKNGDDRSGGSSDEDNDDALASIFAEESFLRKRKRRHNHSRRRTNASNDGGERARRFDAAFHAMMMNLAAAQPQHPERGISMPTKIWSRPDGPHNDTVDGREYMDLKWGVVVPPKGSQSAYSSRRGVPMLAGVDEQYEHASAAEGEGDEEGLSFPPSPARQKFSDIVTRLQQNVTELEGSLVNQAVVPMMRLSKYFLPAQLQDYHPDDEKKEEEQLILMNEYLEGSTNETSRKRLETVFAQMGAGSPTVQERVKEFSQSSYVTEGFVKGIIDTMDSDMVDELESLDPGISERLLLRYIEETNFDPSKDSVDAICQHLDIFARRYLVEARYFEGQRYKDLASSKSPHASERTGSSGLVKRFVDQIEDSAEVEELISADGRLHKPTFARLITRYLGEMIGEPSPSIGGGKAIRRGSGRVADRYLGRKEDGDDCKDEEPIREGRSTTEIVNRFIASMQDAAEREAIVDAHGNLDRDVFENMVSRYLAEASCLEEEEVLHAADMHALRDEGSRKAANAARDVVGELDAVPVEKLRSAPRRISAAFAKRFITQMEQAAEVEPLVTADGKLNKSTFEKLTTRYLVEPGNKNDNNFLSQARSPLALAQARRNAGKVGRRRHVAQPEPENEDEFAGPQSPEFVGRFIQHMEDAVNRESIVTAEGKLDKPAFERLVNRYLTEAAGEAVASSGKSRARIESNDDYTTFPPFGHSYSTGFVKRFAAHMEHISRGEQFESVDKPLLEELVLRCLVEFEKDGLLEGANTMMSGGEVSKSSSTQNPLAKTPSFDDDISRLLSSGFVEGLVQHLDHFSKENHLVDSDGKLDIPSFQRQLTLYLTEISSPSARNGKESAAVITRVGRHDVQRLLAQSQSSSGDGTPQAEEVAFASPGLVSPSESDFFRQMREVDAGKTEADTKQTGKALSRGKTTFSASGESLDSDREDPASDAGSRVGGAGQNDTKGTARRLDMAHKFAGSVSNKVGGFVQMMYGKTRSKEEEMEAVAAFRRNQGDRDDASSMSSFRVSDGMKQVVQNFKASKLSPRNEDEENRFDRSEADDESVGTLERQQSHEGFEGQASTSLHTHDSFSQTGSAAPSAADFSPERARIFHQMVMDKSALIGGGHAERSIIDTDGSEASRTAMDPDVLKHLLLSPTLLTKRHQQAIRAVENRSWEQVSYLLSANPWLAEMTDLTTTQYLLHKVALYGAGEATVDKNTRELIAVRTPPAPEQLNTDLVRMFPASVHKFDQDGNLPLHMATASANFAMIKLLGDRFPSGASVRNEDGMLPLHLIILACASPNIAALGDEHSPTDIIKTVLEYFPNAVAVPDNEGNLPIHTAAVAWRGHAGVDVLYLLLDEARRQIQNPYGARFRNKTAVEDMENASIQTETTVSPTDSANEFDDVVHCTMVRNDFGETPLLAAIHARVGWEMVEALARGLGGTRAALCQDSERNNALHLLVGDRFKDPAAALSILKVTREAATVCNEEGMLPIEVRTGY